MYDKIINEKLKECAKARKNHEIQKAQNIISDLINKYPNCYSVLFEKAMLDKTFKNYDQAKKTFNQLLKTAKRHLALMELGNIEFNCRNYDQALAYYSKLYKEANYYKHRFHNFKDIIFAGQKMAVIYRLQNNQDEALKLYNELLNFLNTSSFKNTKDLAIILSEMGNTYLEKGHVNEALKYYELSLNNSDNAYNYFIELLHISLVYLNAHQTDDTLKITDYILTNLNTLENNQENIRVNALYFQAKALFYNSNFIEAINNFKQLLNTQYHRVALENLIHLNFKIGNYQECLNYLQTYFSCLENLKQEKLQYKKEHFTRLYNIAKLKLGLPNIEVSFDLNMYKHYNLAKVIHKLSQEENLNIFNPQDFLEYLSLNKEDYYGTDIYDVYYVNISNIGNINGQPTDFIKVETLVNTNKVVKVTPTKSLNNEQKKDFINAYELKRLQNS